MPGVDPFALLRSILPNAEHAVADRATKAAASVASRK
jgi:hypothetical protein